MISSCFQSGQAVQIAQFSSWEYEGNSKLILNENDLNGVLNLIEDDYPVEVISITGPTRTGKTFLFSLFARYLSYFEKVSNYKSFIDS